MLHAFQQTLLILRQERLRISFVWSRERRLSAHSRSATAALLCLYTGTFRILSVCFQAHDSAAGSRRSRHLFCASFCELTSLQANSFREFRTRHAAGSRYATQYAAVSSEPCGLLPANRSRRGGGLPVPDNSLARYSAGCSRSCLASMRIYGQP